MVFELGLAWAYYLLGFHYLRYLFGNFGGYMVGLLNLFDTHLYLFAL